MLAGAAMPDYGDEHRLFAQSILTAGVMKEEDAIEIFKNAHKAVQADEPSTGDFSSFLNVVNDKLAPLNFQIRNCSSEITGAKFIGIANTLKDKAAEEASSLEKKHIEIFKMVIAAAVESNGVVDEMKILKVKETGAGHKFSSAKEVEDLLGELTRNNWIERVSNNQIALGSRCFIELSEHIKGQYGEDLQDCIVCHSICIRGTDCLNCNSRVHHPCLNRYFKRAKNQKCPKCSKPWPNGEDVDVDDAPVIAPIVGEAENENDANSKKRNQDTNPEEEKVSEEETKRPRRGRSAR
eukprot:m.17297 g.17297  ORF g.17297 m.17297 type:complete len:295 (+) comp5978_c0_seq1:233-1117(+)